MKANPIRQWIAFESKSAANYGIVKIMPMAVFLVALSWEREIETGCVVCRGAKSEQQCVGVTLCNFMLLGSPNWLVWHALWVVLRWSKTTAGRNVSYTGVLTHNRRPHPVEFAFRCLARRCQFKWTFFSLSLSFILLPDRRRRCSRSLRSCSASVTDRIEERRRRHFALKTSIHEQLPRILTNAVATSQAEITYALKLIARG